MLNAVRGVDTMDVKSVKWIELQYTDLRGIFRSVTTSVDLFTEEVFKNGFGKLDGSSVGLSPIHDSDLVLLPFKNTFSVIPWSESGRYICGIFKEGKRFSKDPRHVAELLENYLSDLNYEPHAGVELEFFLFNDLKVHVAPGRYTYEVISDEAEWSEKSISLRFKSAYHVSVPYDSTYAIREEAAKILANYFNVFITFHHHEVASSAQAEMVINKSTPLKLSDDIQTTKYVLRNIARKYGYVACFLPKPIFGDNGSGLHVHLSLWRNGKNLFYDENDDYAGISQFARYFIGGLIEHGRALAALVAPTTNSYRRLVPGYEAPVYLAWSKGNRSSAIRIPVYHRNNFRSKRIEFRPPDPTANPYLAITAIFLAGLDGVKKSIDPGDPIDEDIYHLPKSKRKELGIKELPKSLDEALDELEIDNEFLKPIFSNELIRTYIELKRQEVKEINLHPTPAEIKYYITF